MAMSGKEKEYWKKYAKDLKRMVRRHRLNTLKRIKRGEMPEGAW